MNAEFPYCIHNFMCYIFIFQIFVVLQIIPYYGSELDYGDSLKRHWWSWLYLVRHGYSESSPRIFYIHRFCA